MIQGGADWEREIERKLRTCDVFILLVSRHSMASDYIVDKEIAIIRGRQANGEDVHFYPLLLTPTPKIALDKVRDKNLRPKGGKPLSGFSINERYQQMSDAADEIAKIATRRARRKSPQARTKAPEERRGPVARITNNDSLRAWLDWQSPEVAIAIATRAALRTAPVAVKEAPDRGNKLATFKFATSTRTFFRSCALAWVAARYPHRASSLRASVAAAKRTTAEAVFSRIGAGPSAALSAANFAVTTIGALAAHADIPADRSANIEIEHDAAEESPNQR